MRVIILMTGIAFGLYFIIADRLKIPYLKASKAIMNMGRKDRRLTTVIEAVIMDLSIMLSRNRQRLIILDLSIFFLNIILYNTLKHYC